MYRANASLCWHDNQQVSVDVFSDYATNGSTFTCEVSGALVSTVHDIASLSGSVKHRHNATKWETNIRVMVRKKQKIRHSFVN